MSGQLRWLWTATIGQLWTKTTLLGWRTTILVRRLLLYFPLGIWLAWEAMLQDYGTAARVPMAILLGPMAAALLLCASTFAALLWRAVNLPFLAFGGIFGLPGLVMMKLADLLWRIEAGPGPAAAQRAATAGDVLEQQQHGQQERLRTAIMHGDGITGGTLAVPVTLNTPQGPVTLQEPMLRGGSLVGRIDGEEQVVGKIEPSGDGFEVRDDSGGLVLAFDHRGIGSEGAVIVHPRGEDRDAWQQHMVEEPPQARKLTGGPLAQTLVAGLLVAASFLVNSLTEQVTAWLSAEDAPEVSSTPQPPAGPVQRHTIASLPEVGARAVTLSWDGTRVATSAQGSVQLWDIQSAAPIWSLDTAGEPVNGVAFSPDGSTIAVTSGNPCAFPTSIRIVDAASGAVQQTFSDTSSGACGYHSVGWLSGGVEIVVSDNQQTHIMNARTGAKTRPIEAAKRFALMSDGDTLVHSAGWLSLSDPAPGGALGETHGTVSLSADGRYAATTGGRGKSAVQVWAFPEGALVCSIQAGMWWSKVTALSSDGTLLAVGGSVDDEKPEQVELEVWSLPDCQLRTQWKLPRYADDLAFTPDSTLLVAAKGGLAEVDARSGEVVRLWETP